MPEFSKTKMTKDGSRLKIINDYAAMNREAKNLGGPSKLKEYYETRGAQQVANELRGDMRVLINEVTDLRRELGYKPNMKVVEYKVEVKQVTDRM